MDTFRGKLEKHLNLQSTPVRRTEMSETWNIGALMFRFILSDSVLDN